MAMKTSKPCPLPSQVSVDTDQVSPRAESYSLSGPATVDAMAGPANARRRTTEELKEDIRRDQAAARQQLSLGQNMKFTQLQAGRSNSCGSSGSGPRMDQVVSEVSKLSLCVGEGCSPSSENSSSLRGDDSSYGSLSSGDFSCGSMPSEDWEEELKCYMHKLPPDLKFGYIDVLILYYEEDRDPAEKFRDHLINDIPVENGPMIAMLYDDPEMEAICGSKIQHLAKGVERSTYVFIFMTKNFVQDKWCEFSSESCLMEAITNPDKQWCVVPVYTEKRNTSFRVPMGLNTLKGINYYNNDKFYRNGVARLIGDKIWVRKEKNQKHKTLQKKKLEEIKRDEIKLVDYQRKIQAMEEAKTQQLNEWLEHETKRLIRDGILPASVLHSSSESDLSSKESSIPHSVSTGSLKPVPVQNPAVTSYFQQLLGQQKIYGCNQANYSAEQISLIEQMFGNSSPQSQNFGFPSQHQFLSQQQYLPQQYPPQMNVYSGQGQWCQGHLGNLPPVGDSAAYNHLPHAVKRSPSQASADMGPSTSFVLHKENTEVSVSIPSALFDKIKDLPEDQQQVAVAFFLEEQDRVSGQGNYLINSCNLNQQQPSSAIHMSHLPVFLQQNSHPSGNMSSLSNHLNSNFENSQFSRSLMSDSTRLMSGQSSTVQAQFTNTMDANPSNPEGNIPVGLFSSLNTDGGSSMLPERNQPLSAQQTFTKGKQPIRVNERQSRVPESYEEVEDKDEGGDEEERKRRGRTVIHKTVYQYNIYQPGAVQIGEGNTVNQGREESDDNAECSDTDSDPVEDTKMTKDYSGVQEKPVSPKDGDQKMKNMDIKPGTESRSEIAEQPEAPRSAGSCMPDAAPSTHQLTAQSLWSEEPRVSTQKKGIDEPLPELQEVESSAKQMSSAAADVERKSYQKFENRSEFEESDDENTKQSNDVKTLEGSVNMNSTPDSVKSSSSQKVILPVSPVIRPMVSIKPQINVGATSASPEHVKTKPVGTGRPVAAVTPFSPGGTNVEENCEYTDPKTVLQTEETSRKLVVGASGFSEETYVKQAFSTQSAPSAVKNDRQSEVPCQMLMNAQDFNDKNETATFSASRNQQTNPQRLFFRNNFHVAEDEGSNVDDVNTTSLDSLDCRITQVEHGEDPLTAESADASGTQNFFPQTAHFDHQISKTGQDFEMVEEDGCCSETDKKFSSLELTGSQVNNGWKVRGATKEQHNLSGSSKSLKQDKCLVS